MTIITVQGWKENPNQREMLMVKVRLHKHRVTGILKVLRRQQRIQKRNTKTRKSRVVEVTVWAVEVQDQGVAVGADQVIDLVAIHQREKVIEQVGNQTGMTQEVVKSHMNQRAADREVPGAKGGGQEVTVLTGGQGPEAGKCYPVNPFIPRKFINVYILLTLLKQINITGNEK